MLQQRGRGSGAAVVVEDGHDVHAVFRLKDASKPVFTALREAKEEAENKERNERPVIENPKMPPGVYDAGPHGKAVPVDHGNVGVVQIMTRRLRENSIRSSFDQASARRGPTAVRSLEWERFWGELREGGGEKKRKKKWRERQAERQRDQTVQLQTKLADRREIAAVIHGGAFPFSARLQLALARHRGDLLLRAAVDEGGHGRRGDR